MLKKEKLTEADLASLAKFYRKKEGMSRADAARNLRVSHVSIHRAEENPKISLLKLRLRMIEAFSPFTVSGPVYYLKRKR